MTKTLCPKCQAKTEGVLVSVWINADGDSVETWQCRKCEAIFDRVIGAKGQSHEPLPFYSAGVNEDKPIAKTIEALKIGVVADTGCTLTAGQCAELLAEIERMTSGNPGLAQEVVNRAVDMGRMQDEIARLRGLLELERSDE